jgi:predicted NodU family carbamoyl transferase
MAGGILYLYIPSALRNSRKENTLAKRLPHMTRARYTLGVVCYGRHEAAAALLKEGVVVAAAEEERFSRRKFDSEFPEAAIKYCLKAANITVREVSAIGYGFSPRRRLFKKAFYLAKHFSDSPQLIRRNGPLLKL